MQTQALLTGVELTAPWRLMLAGTMSGAQGPGDVEAAVDEWANQIERDGPVATLMYESGLRAWMAAQLMVRAVELADQVTASRSAPAGAVVFGRRDEGVSFLELPFEDAIQFFRAKDVLSPEEFRELQDRFRAGGFTAVRLAAGTLRERAKAAILGALESGSTIEETIATIRDDALALGIEPETHGYLATVVRTNISQAYGAGRYAAMNDPDVMALRPYTQILTAGDSRVRASHRALHGKVFLTGSEGADYYAMPGGFSCRCNGVTLSQAQFERRGLVLTEGKIAGVDPDEGWAGPPQLLAA